MWLFQTLTRDSLKVRVKWGLMPLRRHTRRIVVALSPRCSANVRVRCAVMSGGTGWMSSGAWAAPV